MTTKKKTSFCLEERGLCYLVLFVFDSFVGIAREDTCMHLNSGGKS
jgi:hypothetical protein